MGTKQKLAILTAAVAAGAIATGAPAYAARALTGNDIKNSSLTGTDIKNSTLTGADVKDNSLTGRDVKDLTSSDIRNGSLKAADFAPGVIPSAVKGDKGDKGDPGPAGTTRWALIGADGKIAAQSGGFAVTAAYPVLANTAPSGDNSLRANGNVYLDTGSDLTGKGLLASISLQNQVDQNGDGVVSGRGAGADANPEFSGEISVAKCEPAPATFVACAPPGTQNSSTLVVSPRNSDGSFTTDDSRKRFYVSIVG